VTKEQLLQRLNEIAANLGLSPVSKRGLSDWVDEGLIKGARPIGRRRGVNPRWEYDEEDVDRGRAALEARAAGVKRVAELRLYLWARGFQLSPKKVKLALISEFIRLMRTRRREALIHYDHHQRSNLSDRELSTHLKRLGQLDPRLAAINFDLSSKSMLDMSSRLTWGLGEHEQTSAIEQRLFPPGLLGAPDEIQGSGEEELGIVTEADLESARHRLYEFVATLLLLPLYGPLFGVPMHDDFSRAYALAAESMMRPEWLIHSLASFTVSAYRERIGLQDSANKE
jgi:hypothetical protein